MRARTRTALVVAPVVGVGAAALVRLLRGAPSPAFTTPPTVPRLAPDRAPVAAFSERPTAAVAAADPHGAAATPEPVPAGRRWVEPVEGACPEGFEIKVKLRSGIYHRPGMFAYDRTVPDRCYATPEDAQADGFRPAKR